MRRGRGGSRHRLAGASDEGNDARLRGERRQMVAEAAYYRAERRGFAPGSEVEDWLEAEAQIRVRLGS
ncbi:MAG: DUF2934 domain-containing protein [Betaproteobacteria bacterium]|nr:DUF2934 domain-containing protein [Betaproteobacteria bacterium]